MSTHNIFDSLPVEVVLDIVDLALQDSVTYRDALLLSHVSQRLRRITVSYPLLWTQIHIKHTSESLELAKVVFSRSSSARGLAFKIDLREPTSHQLLSHIRDLLQSTSTHIIHALCMHVRDQGHIEACLRCINLSELEHLHISCSHLFSTSSLRLPAMPKLAELAFTGFLPQAQLTGSLFPSVTSLSYLEDEDTEHYPQPTQFCAMLDLFPTVEDMHLKGLWYSEEVDEHMRTVVLTRLRCLILEDVGHFTVTEIFQHVIAPQLDTVRLVDPWSAQDFEWEDAPTPHPSVHSLELLQTVIHHQNNVPARYLPQHLPNLHIIVVDFSMCACWHRLANTALPLWPHLQTIVISGSPNEKYLEQAELDSEEAYYKQTIQWLSEFASARSSSTPSILSPVSITFQVAFPWETMAWSEMYALSPKFDRIQVGDEVIKSGLGLFLGITIPDADAEVVTRAGDWSIAVVPLSILHSPISFLF